MTGHLLLVDASGFCHRAFHSGNPSFRASDGLPTWAVLGFMQMMWSLLGRAQADPATYGAAVFDAPGKNFRHKIFPEYKANRADRRARQTELDPQMPYMRHAAETMGLHSVEAKGFEADDVLATLAHRARKAGIRTTIVSSDKDILQLVRDGEIEVIDPVTRKRMLSADVRKKLGVDPEQVPDFQALAGDSVDNIPGIPGLGKDKSAALIRRFGDLEGVITNIKEIRWPSARAEMRRRSKDALMYRELARLRTDVRLKVKPQDLTMEPIHTAHLKEFLRALEAGSRFEALFGNGDQLIRPVEHDDDPMRWWKVELRHPGQMIPPEPQCGFYKRRLVQGGPWVCARIWREPEIDIATGQPTAGEWLRCEVDGKAKDAVSQWARLAMHPIKEADYQHMAATATWAKAYCPDDPSASPESKINWNRVPL